MNKLEGYLMIKVGSEKPYRESLDVCKKTCFLEAIHSLGFELLNDEYLKRKVVITSYALDDSAPRNYHKIHTFTFSNVKTKQGNYVQVNSTFPWMVG